MSAAMPDSLRYPNGGVLVAAHQQVTAQTVEQATGDVFAYSSWQEEAWNYYGSLGEFNNAVTWRSNALSRVRLTAAEMVPGGDEPKVITEGPAAEAVARIGGGIAGAAKLMQGFGVHLDVPGVAWLLAWTDAHDVERWDVKSADEIRPSARKAYDEQGRIIYDEQTRKPVRLFEVQVDENRWEVLPLDTVMIKVFEPNQRFSWRADSAARPAIPIMRKIDLYDRQITATLLSRIAMNGFLTIPAQVNIPARKEFKDAPDPFIAELVEFASRNIKNPGHAGAALPFPIRIPMEYIDGFKHILTANGVSKDLLDARDRELGRLAITLRVSTERLREQSSANHWGMWQLSEEEIKYSISPLAETICQALTDGWLQPVLLEDGQKLIGPDGGEIIVWYDTSELAVSTDRGAEAVGAYDRLELTGTAYRREIGMDEGDRPEGDELADQLLRKIALGGGQLAPAAYEALTGQPFPAATPADGDRAARRRIVDRTPSAPTGQPGTDEDRGPPGTQGQTPEQARGQQSSLARVLAHAVDLTVGAPDPAGTVNGHRPGRAVRRSRHRR